MVAASEQIPQISESNDNKAPEVVRWSSAERFHQQSTEHARHVSFP
jgi:hypothetical protein